MGGDGAAEEPREKKRPRLELRGVITDGVSVRDTSDSSLGTVCGVVCGVWVLMFCLPRFVSRTPAHAGGWNDVPTPGSWMMSHSAGKWVWLVMVVVVMVVVDVVCNRVGVW